MQICSDFFNVHSEVIKNSKNLQYQQQQQQRELAHTHTHTQTRVHIHTCTHTHTFPGKKPLVSRKKKKKIHSCWKASCSTQVEPTAGGQYTSRWLPTAKRQTLKRCALPAVHH